MYPHRMALPSTESFERFLSGLAVVRPPKDEEYARVVILPERRKLDAVPRAPGDTVRASRDPGVTLFYPRVADLSLEAVVRRVEDELKAIGHVMSAEVARLVLGLFAVLPPSESRSVDRFNRLVKSAIDADVSHFAVFPVADPAEFRFRLGPFNFGPLERERLRYRCERAKSDFFHRFGTEWNNTFAIERDVDVVKLLPWVDLISTQSRWEPAYLLLDAYFVAIQAALFDAFWNELASSQQLLVAAGGPYLDERVLRQVFGLQQISVFLKTGRRAGGWVVPGTMASFVVNLGGADKRIPELVDRLRGECGFERLGDSDVHHSLDTYTRFLLKARRHEVDGNQDEAHLHVVIALELLLGNEEQPSKSVTKRAACLVHRQMGLSFEQACKHIRTLYDARSKYVHEGRTAKSDAFAQVEVVAREVLWCLLRFQRLQESHEKGAFERWLKRLDHLCAALDLAEAPTPEEWERVGVPLDSDAASS